MSDFRLRFTGGVTLEPWTDPADVLGDRPSRLNPRPEHAHTHYVGTVGVQIELTAVFGGVVGPLDATLGGVLFAASFVETPDPLLPVFSSPAGQSSVQRFTPAVAGHYTLKVARNDHGAIICHVDVDT